MLHRFALELSERSAHRRCEQGQPGDAVIKAGGLASGRFLKEARRRPVAGVFGVMSVEVAYPIRFAGVAAPPKLLLNGLIGRSVGFLSHYRLASH
eukprot:scaffold87345_cov37-Prasinocladus_malaysianus.AAC.1